jgi:hypothetical protein
LSGNFCTPCQKACTICKETEYNCLACHENAIRSKTGCQCKKHYEETEAGCEQIKVSFTLSVTENNEIILTFSAEVALISEALQVSVTGLTDFSFTLKRTELLAWQITLDTSQAIEGGATVEVVILDPSVAGHYLLANDRATGLLSAKSAQPTSEEQRAAEIGTVTTASIITVISVSAVLGFSTGSLTSLWVLINNLQIVGYIPMMDLKLSSTLIEFYKSLLGYSFIPSAFNFFVIDESEAPPESAVRVGMGSSLFISNTGESLTAFLLFLALWPAFYLFSKIPALAQVRKHFKKVCRSYRWNFFIRFMIEGYIELVLAVTYQLTYPSLSSLTLCVNVGVASFFAALCVGCPIVCTWFIVKYHRRFSSDEGKFKEKYGCLFEEFKNNRGLISCSYYVLFIIRRLMYVAVLVLLEAFPLVQVLLNLAHTTAMAAFIIVFKPYQEKYFNFTNCFAELCIFLNFSLSALFLLDLSSIWQLVLEWVIVGICYLMILMNFVVTLIRSAKELRETWRRWRNRSSRAKVSAIKL